MEGRYLHVPQSVVDYLQAYYHPWNGELLIDMVNGPVLLIGNELPMEPDLNDWVEPYCWWLRKTLYIITNTFSPNANHLKEKYELAKLHLVVWLVEADLRKGYYYQDKIKAGGVG